MDETHVQASGAGADSKAGGLSALFDLTPDKRVVLDALFDAMTEDIGFNPGTIFDRIDSGQSFHQAMGLPAEAVDVLYAQAFTRFDCGDIESAEHLFRALCLLDGGKVDHWLGHGICLRMNDRLDAAEMAFGVARQLAAGSAVPLFHSLELYVHRGQWEEAKWAIEAIDADENHTLLESMVKEVERYRIAIAVHGVKRSAGHDPNGEDS